MKRVVILGGGSGGAVAAKRLARWSKQGEFEVLLIDRSPCSEAETMPTRTHRCPRRS